MIAMATRRRFLRDASLLSASAALSPGRIWAAPAGSLATFLDQVRFGTFASALGTTFWVLGDRLPAFGIRLVEIRPRPPANARQAAAPDAWNERFSLFFHGSPSEPLDQDTYVFEHRAIGRFEMFIAPIGAGNAGYRRYEAVFNRSAGGGASRRATNGPL